MALEPLSVWKSTLAQIAKVDKSDWVGNLARWMGERSTMKLELMPIQGQVLFNFNQGLFEAQLRSAAPTDLAVRGANQFAGAWANAVMASQMVVMPSSYLAAPTPATTWSVAATLLDPPTITAARVFLLAKLASAAPVDEGFLSHMAEAFRSAFLMVTATVTGMNSLPIPTPLVAPLTPTK